MEAFTLALLHNMASLQSSLMHICVRKLFMWKKHKLTSWYTENSQKKPWRAGVNTPCRHPFSIIVLRRLHRFEVGFLVYTTRHCLSLLGQVFFVWIIQHCLDIATHLFQPSTTHMLYVVLSIRLVGVNSKNCFRLIPLLYGLQKKSTDFVKIYVSYTSISNTVTGLWLNDVCIILCVLIRDFQIGLDDDDHAWV